MYYENNNIVPDYELEVYCPSYKVSPAQGGGEYYPSRGGVTLNVEIENIGRRSMVITGIKFWVKSIHGDTLEFKTQNHNIAAIGTGRKVDFHSILAVNQILSLQPHFIPNYSVSEEELRVIMAGPESEKVIQVINSKGQAFFGKVGV